MRKFSHFADSELILAINEGDLSVANFVYFVESFDSSFDTSFDSFFDGFVASYFDHAFEETKNLFAAAELKLLGQLDFNALSVEA